MSHVCGSCLRVMLYADVVRFAFMLVLNDDVECSCVYMCRCIMQCSMFNVPILLLDVHHAMFQCLMLFVGCMHVHEFSDAELSVIPFD